MNGSVHSRQQHEAMCMDAGSMTINTRVTRRSQETPTPDKINTSEYFQQIFETPGRPQAKVYARLTPILLFANKQKNSFVFEHFDMPDSIAVGHCSLCKGCWLHSVNVCNAFLGLAYDALLCMQAVHAVAASREQLVYEQHMFCSAWLKQPVLHDPFIKHVSSPKAQVCGNSVDMHLLVQSQSYAFTAHHMLASGALQVKASQCYTKYKFRSQEAADRQAGPAIVATQVISDYLTAYDGELQLIKAQNRPVVVYTYSMVFIKQRGMPV